MEARAGVVHSWQPWAPVDGHAPHCSPAPTCRAAKTLLYYFFELNPTLYGWFNQYIKQNEIPRVSQAKHTSFP